uniref:Uncharacterized protein n=1 Tax=Tanacetum cinerariifolium TaxID=118510 RepID=A0A6L2MAV6_TANCI|nr:hypothetical protein [Tanacetum cinerariifolium]GEW47517.1 hypothetical protein [Tanacetum cinerariifolium]
MYRECEDFVCSFLGDELVSFISTVKDLHPKFIHLEQTDLKAYLVTFYTSVGDEIDYWFTKDHEMKYLVVGSIPHHMLLTFKRYRLSKCVPIEFNGVVLDIGLSFSFSSRLKKLVGVALLGLSAKDFVNVRCFVHQKLLLYPSVSIMLHLLGRGWMGVYDTAICKKICSGQGESSNSVGCSERSFIAVFSLCVDTKGYLICFFKLQHHPVIK